MGTWTDRLAGALLGENCEAARILVGLEGPGISGGTGLPQVGLHLRRDGPFPLHADYDPLTLLALRAWPGIASQGLL